MRCCYLGPKGPQLPTHRGVCAFVSMQALEPSTLIALQLLAPGGRLVLVGDPQQLPATVVSRAAAAASLAQSLFERLMQASFLGRPGMPALPLQHGL